MMRLRSIPVLLVLATGLSLAWGQDDSNPQPPASGQSVPPAATGPGSNQETQSPGFSENPPISGIDLPNLQPHAASLSYLQPGAHVSESIDSNVENSLGGSNVSSISRAEGSLELRRLWSNYDLSLDYLGGIGYYDVRGVGLRQIQELGFYQKVSWKRGEFGVRDSFSYQPEGSFGSAYGAVGATGAGLAEEGNFFGGTALGALGQVPRIMNVALADAVESLSPKSALTATVGYGLVHFLQNQPDTNAPFIGDSQTSGELGYSRILGPHDQGALIYGYQDFHFSTGVNFHDHVIQLLWGHRISGRMDFLAAAGPQFLQINHLYQPVTAPTSADQIPPCLISATLVLECPTNDLRISAAGRARLRYQFPKVTLLASYEHFLTAGSGFFEGAESDIASLNASRPLGRIWSGFTDIGYSRNARVTPLTCSGPTCPGVSANTYQYLFAGVGIHRMLGRNFHLYASYQFNELLFDSSYCGTAGACNRISNREVGTFGFDWTPRPVRLD